MQAAIATRGQAAYYPSQAGSPFHNAPTVTTAPPYSWQAIRFATLLHVRQIQFRHRAHPYHDVSIGFAFRLPDHADFAGAYRRIPACPGHRSARTPPSDVPESAAI